MKERDDDGCEWGRRSERRRTRARTKPAWLVALVLIGASLLGWGPALAQDAAERDAAAEAMFRRGVQLLVEEKFEAACRHLERSQKVDPGVGTLLYLGLCYERQGRLASAWVTYREAESAARAAALVQRSRVATEHALRLLPKLSTLTVLVAPENRVADFELRINDKVMSPDLFGVPFVVDAGRYNLSARARGRRSWSSRVELDTGGGRMAVHVPPLERPLRRASSVPADLSEPPRPTAGVDAAIGEATSPPMQPSRPLSVRQRTALIVAGSGLAALGLGTFFGLIAARKNDLANRDCSSAGCVTREGADLNEQARTWAAFANGTYAAGGLAVITGAVLYLWPGNDPQAQSALHGVSADLGLGGGMLTLHGVL
jgi:serine/threonine-protein kinase